VLSAIEIVHVGGNPGRVHDEGVPPAEIPREKDVAGPLGRFQAQPHHGGAQDMAGIEKRTFHAVGDGERLFVRVGTSRRRAFSASSRVYKVRW